MNLPADGAYPVFYPFTGVGYALDAEMQKRWQDDVDRMEGRLIAAIQRRIAARGPQPKSPKFISDFINQPNPFKVA